MNLAFITGCYGQDGLNLISHLNKLDYSIIGLVRKKNVKLNQYISSSYRNVEIIEINLNDQVKVNALIKEFAPNEIYNLAGMSIPSECELNSKQAIDTNIGIPLFLLEEVKSTEIKLFQASSSEIFGNSSESIQNEETKLNPRNVYGITKAASHFAVGNYRLNYGVLASSGIMYNHESEFRDERIVTTKIICNLLRIKYSNDKSKFSLGNIYAMRDWGYSGDFVQAMWLILQQPKMEDFIISTNVLHSVKDFLLLAMDNLNLGSDVMQFINIDEDLFRKNDLGNLQGDYSKINNLLGWKPSLDLEQIIERMIKYKYNELYGDKSF
jgi:GDPmannose 4,6-dehydratase